MKLWVGHESGTHTHGQGKLYMPFRHFMAGGGHKNFLNGPLSPKQPTIQRTRGYQKVLSLRHFPHSDSTMLHT